MNIKEAQKLHRKISKEIMLRNSQLAIMRASDAYAARASKLGVPFVEIYPEKYNEYMQAYDRYQEHDATIKELESQLIKQ